MSSLSPFWLEAEPPGRDSLLDVMAANLPLRCDRLKLKRPQTAKKFRAELDRLYEEALAEEVTGGKVKASL